MPRTMIDPGPVQRLVLAAVAMLLSAGSGRAFVTEREWQSAHERDHPLVGTVWNGSGTRSDASQLLQVAGRSHFVLIGETHPNPDHHVIQAALIARLAHAGRAPSIVFEMIPAPLQAQLDVFVRTPDRDVSELGALLDWTDRGWPAWPIYEPIATVALAHKLPLVAGDLDRDTIHSIGMAGRAAATLDPPAEAMRRVPLPEGDQQALLRTLKDAHCDLLPEAALSPMAAVQRARDAAMAAAMIESGATDGSVLIAGAGHVRLDWGVPHALRAGSPDTSVVSIALIEVFEDAVALEDYVPDSEGNDMPFDFVVFTPRHDLTDHCAELADAIGEGHSNGAPAN